MIRRLFATGTATVLALAFGGLVAGPSYADHETRSAALQDAGTDVSFFILTGMVIAGAILLLAVFAAIILRWEQMDKKKDN